MDDPTIYVRVTALDDQPIARADELNGIDDITDGVVELTGRVAGLIRTAIGNVAAGLRPDLEAIGASKATVKLGMKVAVKNGKLTALVTEVGGEASVEVSVEFTK